MKHQTLSALRDKADAPSQNPKFKGVTPQQLAQMIHGHRLEKHSPRRAKTSTKNN